MAVVVEGMSLHAWRQQRRNEGRAFALRNAACTAPEIPEANRLVQRGLAVRTGRQRYTAFAPLRRVLTPVVPQDLGGEAVGDSGCGRVHRIMCEMSIPRGGFYLIVAQQLADHRQTLAEGQRSGGEPVSQIMNPDIAQPGARPDDIPGVLEVAQMRVGAELREGRCRAKVKYVLGLSATVTRQDGHHPIVFMQCGPVRFRASAKSQARPRPFAHRALLRLTAFRLLDGIESERPPIQHVYAALTEDATRNDMIFDDVLSALEAGRSSSCSPHARTTPSTLPSGSAGSRVTCSSCRAAWA